MPRGRRGPSPHHPTSIRLRIITLNQMTELQRLLGLTRTEVMGLAIDRLYRQEFHGDAARKRMKYEPVTLPKKVESKKGPKVVDISSITEKDIERVKRWRRLHKNTWEISMLTNLTPDQVWAIIDKHC